MFSLSQNPRIDLSSFDSSFLSFIFDTKELFFVDFLTDSFMQKNPSVIEETMRGGNVTKVEMGVAVPITRLSL